MITVNFWFENHSYPDRAEAIQAGINRRIQQDTSIDININAVVDAEYRGNDSIGWNLPMVIPMDVQIKILTIVHDEIRNSR